MGIALTLADASFDNFIDKAIPYWADVAGYWLLGGTSADSLLNLKTGVAGTEVGTPAYGVGYCSISKDNGIETDVVLDEDEDKTLIIVATPAVTGYCGTWHSSKTHALIQTPTTTLSAVRADMVSTGAVTATADGGPYRFMAGTYDNTAGQQVAYGAAAGTMISASGARGPFSITATNAFRIGAQSVATTGTSNAAAAMVFQRKLTGTEIGEVYAYLKFKLGLRGIRVS